MGFLFHLQNTERNPFKIGMKLEADCVKDSSKLCLASIGDVIDNRVLVTFDGIDHTLSYWTDINSPYLHPINWHQRNGCTLSLPQGIYPFVHHSNFTDKQEKYIQKFSVFQHAISNDFLGSLTLPDVVRLYLKKLFALAIPFNSNPIWYSKWWTNGIQR